MQSLIGFFTVFIFLKYGLKDINLIFTVISSVILLYLFQINKDKIFVKQKTILDSEIDEILLPVINIIDPKIKSLINEYYDFFNQHRKQSDFIFLKKQILSLVHELYLKNIDGSLIIYNNLKNKLTNDLQIYLDKQNLTFDNIEGYSY